MKKRTKRRGRRITAALVTLSLAAGMFGGVPVLAEETETSPPPPTEAAEQEAWTPQAREEFQRNTAGDLSLQELAVAELPAEDIPETVSAETAARQGHVHRLRQQEKDLNTVIFQNRDGTKTLYQYARPVKYVDESGAVRDKSNALSGNVDDAYAADYGYVTAENDVKTYFPKSLGRDKGILLTYGDVKLTMYPAHKTVRVEEQLTAEPETEESAAGPVQGPTALTTKEEQPVPPGNDERTAQDGQSAATGSIAQEDLENKIAAESEEAEAPAIGPVPGPGTGTFAPDRTLDDMAADTDTALPEESSVIEESAEKIQAQAAPAEKKALAQEAEELPADVVEYDKVFGEDTLLRYTPAHNGFKEDLVLSRDIGVNAFTFRVETGGLSLTKEEDSYFFSDPLTGEHVAMLSQILVYDSHVPEVAADIPQEKPALPDETLPAEETATGPLYTHTYRVETVRADEEYLVTLVVDEDYLRSPERVYPVTIDPSFTVGASGIQDATVYTNYRVNEGLSGSVFVGNYSARYGGSRGQARTLVKFPGLFSNSTFNSLSASQISSVKFYVRDLMCESDQVWIDCYRATDSWTETGVKCNNAIWGGYTNFLDDALVYYNHGTAGPTSTAAGNWYGFDITVAVKDWKNGSYANQGIMLKEYNASSGARTLASADRGSYTPQLVVNYGVAVSQVCLSPTSMEMEIGDTRYLTGTVVPSNAVNTEVYYTSSNSSVASVGYWSGLVCAGKAGTATIKAISVADSSKYATCTIVIEEKIKEIDLLYSDSLFISQLINPDAGFNKPESNYALDFDRAYN